MILNALKEQFEIQPFSVLFCDEVASQTGRILEIKPVYDWCKSNNIVLVVDGT